MVTRRTCGKSHRKGIARGQSLGVFQQQHALAGAGVTRPPLQTGNHKGRGKHPGRHRVARFRGRFGQGREQQGRKGQAALAKASSQRKVFEPQGRAFAAKGKVTPCTATLPAQQRAIELMGAGRKSCQPTIHGQLTQTHDG